MATSAIFRHRVTIQQPGTDQVESGQPVETWQDVCTVWAAIEPLRGREYFAAQQINADVTTRIRIRYRPGILPTMRVVYGARVFNLVSPPIDPEERHVELHLMTREVV